MKLPTLPLSGEGLSLPALETLLQRCRQPDGSLVALVPHRAKQKVEWSRRHLEGLLRSGRAFYGINTGFGKMQHIVIRGKNKDGTDRLGALQRNLILSHAVGVGEPIEDDLARLMLALKINGLVRGHSGVRWEVIERLLGMLNEDILPIVPRQGSLGASGDLAPLSHLVLPLLGVGDVRVKGKRMAAAKVLPKGLELSAKEGLALINGTQFCSAHAVLGLLRAKRIADSADIIAAMSLEAMLGSRSPFDPRIHQTRPHAGAVLSAARVLRHVKGSQVLAQRTVLLDALPSIMDLRSRVSDAAAAKGLDAARVESALENVLFQHEHKGTVQDPYSLRCVPQVHGACRDALSHVAEVTEREINSTTDNPLLFADDPNEETAVLSGGNFHAEPLALPLDYAAIAVSELASISERRGYLLLGRRGGLPSMLVLQDPGFNSGMMIYQYTAASLVSENKVLCHPASADSITSSDGQEDHVSMGSIAGTKLLRVIDNAARVLAVELLMAAQGLECRVNRQWNGLGKDLKAGTGVQAAYDLVRSKVEPMRQDDEASSSRRGAPPRLFADEIEIVAQMILTGELTSAVPGGTS